MSYISDVFENFPGRPKTQDGVFSEDELRLANRNSGILLETLRQEMHLRSQHHNQGPAAAFELLLQRSSTWWCKQGQG